MLAFILFLKCLSALILVAQFPATGRSQVQGQVQIFETFGDTVHITVVLQGLPSSGYPFSYHIHEHPVSGDCLSTGGHFNPLNGKTPCAAQASKADCQAGDLSGKWGTISTPLYRKSYDDPYLSLSSCSPDYIGLGRSVVFHFANDTRFACANLIPRTGYFNYSTYF